MGYRFEKIKAPGRSTFSGKQSYRHLMETPFHKPSEVQDRVVRLLISGQENYVAKLSKSSLAVNRKIEEAVPITGPRIKKIMLLPKFILGTLDFFYRAITPLIFAASR
jgi:hypothetical protein